MACLTTCISATSKKRTRTDEVRRSAARIYRRLSKTDKVLMDLAKRCQKLSYFRSFFYLFYLKLSLKEALFRTKKKETIFFFLRERDDRGRLASVAAIVSWHTVEGRRRRKRGPSLPSSSAPFKKSPKGGAEWGVGREGWGEDGGDHLRQLSWAPPPFGAGRRCDTGALLPCSSLPPSFLLAFTVVGVNFPQHLRWVGGEGRKWADKMAQRRRRGKLILLQARAVRNK